MKIICIDIFFFLLIAQEFKLFIKFYFFYLKQSKLAQTACISACKHVAQALMNQMINPDIKAINMGAIEQLNLDLLQCESIINFFGYFKTTNA